MWRLVLFVWFLTFPLFALCNPAVEKSFRDHRQGRVSSIIIFCFYRHGFVYFPLYFVTWDMQTDVIILGIISFHRGSREKYSRI